MGLRQTRIKLNSLGEESPREIVSGRRVHDQNAPADEEIVRFDIRRAATGERCASGRAKGQQVRQGGDDLADHLVL